MRLRQGTGVLAIHRVRIRIRIMVRVGVGVGVRVRVGVRIMVSVRVRIRVRVMVRVRVRVRVSSAKATEHVCSAYVFCCPQAGRWLRLGLRFELGVAPPPTFSAKYLY